MNIVPTLFVAVGDLGQKTLDSLSDLISNLPPIWKIVKMEGKQAEDPTARGQDILWRGLQQIIADQNLRKALNLELDVAGIGPRVALVWEMNKQEKFDLLSDGVDGKGLHSGLSILQHLKEEHRTYLDDMEISLFLLHWTEAELKQNLGWLSLEICKSFPTLTPVQIWVVDIKKETSALTPGYMVGQMARWLYLWACEICRCPHLQDKIRENQTKFPEDLLLATGSFGIEEIPLENQQISEKLASRFYYQCLYPMLNQPIALEDGEEKSILDWLSTRPLPIELVHEKLKEIIERGIDGNKGIAWIRTQLQTWGDYLEKKIVAFKHLIECTRWKKSPDELELRLLDHPLPKALPPKPGPPTCPVLFTWWQKFLLTLIILLILAGCAFYLFETNSIPVLKAYVYQYYTEAQLLYPPSPLYIKLLSGLAISILSLELLLLVSLVRRFFKKIWRQPHSHPILSGYHKVLIFLFIAVSLLPYLWQSFFREISTLLYFWQGVLFLLAMIWGMIEKVQREYDRQYKQEHEKFAVQMREYLKLQEAFANIDTNQQKRKAQLNKELTQKREEMAQIDQQRIGLLNIREKIRLWIKNLEFYVGKEGEEFSSLLDSVYQPIKQRLQQQFPQNMSNDVYQYLVQSSQRGSYFENLLQQIQQLFLGEIRKAKDIQETIRHYISQKDNPVLNWRLGNECGLDHFLSVRLSEDVDFPCEFTPPIALKNKEKILWLVRVVQLDSTSEINTSPGKISKGVSRADISI